MSSDSDTESEKESSGVTGLEKWLDHEKRWIEHAPDDGSFESAIRYLNWRMCCQRDLEPIVNRKQFREEALFLWKFRNKVTEVNEAAPTHSRFIC